jgi:hypothetical protein
MTLFRRRVILSDLLAADLDGAVAADEGGDLVIGFAGLAKGVDFIADHSYESREGKHFGSEAGCCAQGFLRSHSFFDGVEFGSGFSGHASLLSASSGVVE